MWSTSLPLPLLTAAGDVTATSRELLVSVGAAGVVGSVREGAETTASCDDVEDDDDAETCVVSATVVVVVVVVGGVTKVTAAGGDGSTSDGGCGTDSCSSSCSSNNVRNMSCGTFGPVGSVLMGVAGTVWGRLRSQMGFLDA